MYAIIVCLRIFSSRCLTTPNLIIIAQWRISRPFLQGGWGGFWLSLRYQSWLKILVSNVYFSQHVLKLGCFLSSCLKQDLTWGKVSVSIVAEMRFKEKVNLRWDSNNKSLYCTVFQNLTAWKLWGWHYPFALSQTCFCNFDSFR